MPGVGTWSAMDRLQLAGELAAADANPLPRHLVLGGPSGPLQKNKIALNRRIRILLLQTTTSTATLGNVRAESQFLLSSYY